MEKELPKIDLPEEWLVGTGISKELLGLYRNYPVRLKCEIFVLCTSGEVEASVNLNKIAVEANDFIVLTPGSIFQINDIKGDLNIYFGGFSSEYIERNLQSHSFLDTMYLTLGRPLIKMYEFLPEKIRPEMAPNLYADIHKGISILYRNKTDGVHSLSKSELICRNFAQLVMQHYNQTRNVAWYAEKLQITHAHLCTTVKQITGKTCVDIISSMVIMDAKSQLKSSQLSIQNISDSLNFANVSFFGKYFKRYVGMSPLEYRNNG